MLSIDFHYYQRSVHYNRTRTYGKCSTQVLYFILVTVGTTLLLEIIKLAIKSKRVTGKITTSSFIASKTIKKRFELLLNSPILLALEVKGLCFCFKQLSTNLSRDNM